MTSTSGGSDETPIETPTSDAPASAGEDEKDDEDDEDDEDEKSSKKKDKKDKKDKDKGKKDKPEKVKVDYEAAMPRDEAVSYFEALVAGLRSGHLEFRQGDRMLVLNPPDQLEIEVSAQQKGDKGKVSFEISWRGQSRPLAIVGDEPEPAPASDDD